MEVAKNSLIIMRWLMALNIILAVLVRFILINLTKICCLSKLYYQINVNPHFKSQYCHPSPQFVFASTFFTPPTTTHCSDVCSGHFEGTVKQKKYLLGIKNWIHKAL
jgi:hypothetical protein